MSCFKNQKIKKITFLPKKEPRKIVNLTGENLPEELLDKIRTRKLDKIVRIQLTNKSIVRYKIKYKPTGNRSEK